MSAPSRSRWLMRGLLLFVLAFANLNDIWSPDVLPNALFTFTVVREADVDYDEFVMRPAERDRLADVTTTDAMRGAKLDSEAYFFRACGKSTATAPPKTTRSPGGPPAPGPNDHVCSIFPPGMALLAFPFFLPFALSGAEALDLGLLLRVGHVAAAVVETIATLLLWSVLRRFVSERWALALVLLYFLGTSVRTIASQALWQHAGVHLAIAGALWLVLVERPVNLRRQALAGLALGLGGVARQTTVLVSLGMSGSFFVRPLAVLAAFAGAAVGLLPLLLFNWFAFGSPLEQGYGTKPFDTPLLEGLAGLLLAPSRGLFVYEPWALLALGALAVALWTSRRAGDRLGPLLLVWILLLLLYSTYAEWWGGRVFGPRFLDDLAPVLIVGLASGISRGMLLNTALRVFFWLSAAWSFLIFNAAAFVYDQSWDTYPTNVNFDASRLWSWSDPQWLAVLRALPGGGARVVVAAGLTALALLLLLRIERVIASRR